MQLSFDRSVPHRSEFMLDKTMLFFFWAFVLVGLFASWAFIFFFFFFGLRVWWAFCLLGPFFFNTNWLTSN